jgi:hypothetical protein
MRLATLVFLPAALFATDPILLETGSRHTPPPAGDARKFLALICPSRIVKDKYDFEVLACQTCPKWTTDPGAGQLAATAIHYGHFTSLDADQALVATTGCEPHSANWGGSMLFTSHQGKWRFDRYLQGAITDNCAALQRTDGRTILVCSRDEGHQSVLTRFLYTTDLLRPKESIEVPALVLTDTMPTCGFNYASTTDKSVRPLQKADFRKISVNPDNGDVLAEVEFGNRKITETQAKACNDFQKNERPPPKTIAPRTRSYEIRFHFDGERLLASTETADAMRIVQDQHADPHPFIRPPQPPPISH